ncbi:complex I subunit 5 family protein [Orenia marismortui]|uniref:Multicomponent Na+:H+ antiporter subunit D n=1 Tax=Orenia marismortui TaxID=46469 RepID=A0A4R8GZC3_9FIRM|nr:proton-conducting transporter membrane subunit [Orenia marismortui]TDX48021.1 multicomponent Na+:H+ antiporter subunit D [Orenia marismortui]
MIEAIWIILIPLITAFILPLISQYSNKLMRIIVIISGIANLLVGVHILVKAIEQPLVYNLGAWGSRLGINLVIDPLSALMIVLVNLISFAIIYYSLDYISENQSKYYLLLFLLITGMLGLVSTADLFNLYVFVEMTSITSYALVAFAKKDISFEASFKYLIMGSVSGALVLLAIILVYQSTGTLNLAQLVTQIQVIPLITKRLILALLIIGFGTKFAIAPLHTWLADAHPAAPSPISAILSGVVIKVYIYALIRILFLLFNVQELLSLDLDILLTHLGVITLFIGHLLAYQQEELKRLLAYSTIAQVGYIIIGIGLMNLAGLEGAIYHIINHSIVKAVLFMTVGIFISKTGKTNICNLTGLGYSLPLTSFIFTISALNIIGLPPLNSFISKWLLTTAALKSGFIIPAMSIFIGSIISLSYYLRVVISLYSKSGDKIDNILVSGKLKLPTVILSLLYPFLSMCPNFLLSFIQEVATFLLEAINYQNILLGGEKWIGLFT